MIMIDSCGSVHLLSITLPIKLKNTEMKIWYDTPRI